MVRPDWQREDPDEGIVCMDYPNCDRPHAGGMGGVPLHPPAGACVSGDEPLIDYSEPSPEEPLNLHDWQTVVGAWCRRNFGIQSDLVLYGGTGEEAGELLRGAVKREQGIRGTREEWNAVIRAEMGDIVIKLATIAAKEGWQLDDIIRERWSEVSKRDWVADKVGHGLPEDDS